MSFSCFRSYILFNLGSLKKSSPTFKSYTVHTNHCTIQLKWPLVAVKHQQLALFFTQVINTGKIIDK